MKGKVYLVGAGCGSYELLTLKAKEVLSICDCVIYDRLVDDSILQFCNKDAEFIYLGKDHANYHLQDTINETIVKYAKEDKLVVRLKGGDPLVFGRGGEELDCLYNDNIPFEIVPGISSSIASSEYAGIPLTYRDISRSFHVFTAHAMDTIFDLDFKVISQLEGTLVFLMGVAKVSSIVDGLISNGRDANTKIAVVENACRPVQRVITGTLSNILEKVKINKIKAPATIIVGDVVSFQERFSWYDKLPLIGKSILITRPEDSSNTLSNRLISLGAKCHILPMISINNKDTKKLDLSKYNVILFCSSNGVNSFFNNIDDIRVLGNIKIGAIGKATLNTLKQYRIKADFIPKKFYVDALIEESINHTTKDDNILIVTSNLSPVDTDFISKKYSRNFTKYEMYNTIKIKHNIKDVVSAINKVDYITFFSPSSVESFMESINNDTSLLQNKKIVSIGPITSRKIKECNLSVYLEAYEYDSEGVINSLLGDK